MPNRLPAARRGDARRAAVEAWCAERSVETICQALMEAGVPVAPVKTIPQVAKDPHLWEREMLVKMEDPVAGEMYLPGVTVKMSRTPGRVGPVPTPGQHTDEVLGRLLGYDADTLRGLARSEGDRVTMQNIAIIGAGIGGIYLAATLGAARLQAAAARHRRHAPGRCPRARRHRGRGLSPTASPRSNA